jgi:hypothetical protein
MLTTSARTWKAAHTTINMSGHIKKYSKRRIAEVQIFRAIRVLVEDSDPISAITLAGAAEEILGKKLQDSGKPCAFDDNLIYDKRMWAYAAENSKKTGRALAVPKELELKKQINRARNELKHKGENRSLVAVFDYEAEEIILRALKNYVLFYQKPLPQKYVQAWYENITL